ncbi:MAG: hypothetical protein JKY94_09170 [Rhodobacteraceae bacterium]|nr:hypothetical protein [Paracoccaceae bacterium]
MTSHIKKQVESSLKVLSATWLEENVRLISVPVQYPSGALTVIEVSGGSSTVVISDRGMGLWEAESYGAEKSYNKIAYLEAQCHGLRFDGHAVLALEVPLEQLSGGIVAVANASARASAEAIRIEASHRIEAKREVIYEKVRFAFPNAHVSKKLEVPGERATWEAHNVVSLRLGRIAIFEPVSVHPSSVSAKFLMFADLSKRESITLNAVFSDPDDLDPKARMISEVAHIMGVESDIEAYRQSAA